jgi:hypothetical protein
MRELLAEVVCEGECGQLCGTEKRRLDRVLVPGGAVVEDEDDGRSCGGRVPRLDGEEAASPADERDGAADEPVEIRLLAAARLRVGVDRLKDGLDVAAAGVAKRNESSPST